MTQQKLILTALSGLALVGVTFGMARYGYGLYLPRFVQTYGLNKTAQGLIGSGSYAGYLVATLFASWGAGRFGPKILLMLSAIAAALGTALVAEAHSALMLAVGVIIAGASPGIIFPALSEWVSMVADEKQKNSLFTIMNSGTGAGIVVSAGLVAFTSVSVSHAWWLFSVCAVVFGILAAWLAPGGKAINAHQAEVFQFKDLLLAKAWSLYGVAVIAGFVTAIYWTFSVDTISHSLSGKLGDTDPALIFWIATGFFGFVGALAGDAINNRGLGNVLALTMVAIAIALALLGMVPDNLPLVLVSGVIFGAAFIFITGLLGVWSMAIFPNRPSAAFGVTFLLFTAGAAAGPALSGLLAAGHGQGLVFNLAACIALAPCLAWSSANRAVA